MKAYSKVTAVGAALLFVGALAGTALAIEAFSERFEEDFSQPRTILARVIVVDPYEDAVWVNWVWKGVRNSGEINQFWAMMRSEEHTSELQSLAYLVCRLLLEKKNCTDEAASDRIRRLLAGEEVFSLD